MKPIRARLAFILTSLWLVTACNRGDSPTSTIVQPPPVRTATLSISKAAIDNGDLQTAEVATVLPKPVRVQVMSTDTNGVTTPGVGVQVLWNFPGATTSVASTTDAQGIASAQWTLAENAGTQEARARLALNAAAIVQLSATALPGAVYALHKVAGDSQNIASSSSAVSAPFIVRAVDRFSNPLGLSENIRWSVLDGPIEIHSATSSPTLMDSYADIRSSGVGGVGRVRATLGQTNIVADFVVYLSGPIFDVNIDDPTGSDVLPVFVSARNNSSQPAVDTIPIGASVRWTNQMYFDVYMQPMPVHQVFSIDTPSFPTTPPVGVHKSVSVTFTQPGVYRYSSTHSSRMTGIVVVR